MITRKKASKSKLFYLKVLVLSLLSFIVMPFVVPFNLYRSTLELASTHLSRYKDLEKFKYVENKFYDASKRFDYSIEILINYGKSFFVSKDSININMSFVVLPRFSGHLIKSG